MSDNDSCLHVVSDGQRANLNDHLIIGTAEMNQQNSNI